MLAWEDRTSKAWPRLSVRISMSCESTVAPFAFMDLMRSGLMRALHCAIRCLLPSFLTSSSVGPSILTMTSELLQTSSTRVAPFSS